MKSDARWNSSAKLALSLVFVAAVAACGGGADTPAETPASSPAANSTAGSSPSASVATAVEVPVPSLAPVALGGANAATDERGAGTSAGASGVEQPAVAAVSADSGRVEAARVVPAPSSGSTDASSASASGTPQAASLVTAMQAASAVAGGTEIFVSTIGNDAWSGALSAPNAAGTDGPLRTLAAAQQRARALLAAMAGSGQRTALRVRIQPGTYVLSSTLNFSTADSGSAGAPVSWEAVTPGSVLISGAVPLSLASAANGSTPARFANPAAAGTAWDAGSQLFVNGRRAVLARTPNAGQYWFVQKALPLATEPSGSEGRTAFGAAADALNTVAALSASDRSRAVVNVMHAWTTSQHRLAGSAPSGAIQLATPALWTFLSSGTSQRYWIENVASALDAPGEYFWDASGVRYIPRSDEAGVALNAAMPVLDRLVTVTGDVARGQWVSNLQFRGLTFGYTRSQMPSGGFLDWQAATGVAAAFEADAANSLVIDGCRFVGTGGYGVWLRRAVRSSSVTNSTFDDLGAGGIKLGMISPWSGDPQQTGANSASNNIVGNTGKLYPGAVGIWVGRSFDNTVANNLVYNTTYTGISVGWSWDFGEATSGRNLVADNLLINIGQGQLADMGAIYTVGVSPQTRITGNVIREVRSYPAYGAGAWGIYADMGSSLLTISDNIVLGTDSGGLQVSSGRSNVVQNNVFGGGEFAELSVPQPDPLTALTFNGNVLVPKADKAFANNAKSPYVSFANNEVSSVLATKALDRAMCGAGCSATSTAVIGGADPRNVMVISANSSLSARASQLAAKAGPTALATAANVVTVPTQKPAVGAAVASSISFELDIANAAIGSQPLGFWYSAKGNSAATGIVANASAPGGRCLQYTDSAANVNGYDPHTYAPLNHSSGITTGEFDLLIDANTYFVHQWRDGGSPAKTGPAMEVKATGVYVAGSMVAPVTVGKWMKFRITAPLGGQGSSWTLQVTDGDGRITSRSGFSFVSAGWGSLNWWGFVSNAKVATNLCLASVKATNLQ